MIGMIKTEKSVPYFTINLDLEYISPHKRSWLLRNITNPFFTSKKHTV